MDLPYSKATQGQRSGGPIVIVPYRYEWPKEFTALGQGIRDVLGPLALRIDHIGSTSVPGLAAKDVIDIQITVGGLDEEVAEAMQRAGHVRREPIRMDHVPPGQPEDTEQWSKWLYRPAVETRRANVHVRAAGRLNQCYPLLFRDYLRARPAAAQAYGLVKTALARQQANDVEAYYDVKDPVCDIIMAAAEEWAAANHWEPGPSDA